jgi:hypothetical protein
MPVSREIADAAEDLLVHVRWMSGLLRERLGGVELCLLRGRRPGVCEGWPVLRRRPMHLWMRCWSPKASIRCSSTRVSADDCVRS